MSWSRTTARHCSCRRRCPAADGPDPERPARRASGLLHGLSPGRYSALVLGRLRGATGPPRYVVVRREWGANDFGGGCLSMATSGRTYGDYLETVDASEVARVCGVDRQLVGERCRGDHRVVCAGLRLATTSPQRCGDSPERSRGRGIERQRLEIGLGLLQHGLPSSTLLRARGYERTHRKLRQRYRRDEGYGR